MTKKYGYLLFVQNQFYLAPNEAGQSNPYFQYNETEVTTLERKRYDLCFKKMVVAKGREAGNMI
ncbi:hypothetical protein [Paenibacillus roseus]|uniref:hypothetical protein n=1 Tax=Paenibacillus sp. GCM10012307 TaxID=3317343 RepID=UPI0036D4334A